MDNIVPFFMHLKLVIVQRIKTRKKYRKNDRKETYHLKHLIILNCKMEYVTRMQYRITVEYAICVISLKWYIKKKTKCTIFLYLFIFNFFVFLLTHTFSFSSSSLISYYSFSSYMYWVKENLMLKNTIVNGNFIVQQRKIFIVHFSFIVNGKKNI